MDDDDFEMVIAGLDLFTGGHLGRLQRFLRALPVESSAQRMDQALKEDWKNWVESTLAALTRRVEEQYEGVAAEERPTMSDVAAVMVAAQRVYRRTGDRNKRELLSWAVANAFEPELYKKGLHLRLLRLVDDLEYGDVRVLRRMTEGQVSLTLRSLDDHHAHVLVKADLAYSASRDGSIVKITDLGKQMLLLLREPPTEDEA